ncbi:8-amino-7-oxononanoate synthase [Paxillus ammoniavirescens]|nr:8-amino-7-oxononanoate synthase [Paxillus ammoniavirescens]
MSQDSRLLDALQKAIVHRAQTGLTTFSLDEPLPTFAADLFSNDYLSLSTDTDLREGYLRRAQAAPLLFGSTGSRLGTGNSKEYNALERRLQRFFGFPSALLFHSGFSANSAFFASVPRKEDIIIYDELIHISCREGFRLSGARGATYRFAHNSVASFEECLRDVLRKHPQIAQGQSTVFVSVESLYSMDGDFCPLMEIVQLVEDLVPAGHAHIVVDEAHTSAICGPNGTGYVSLLRLDHRVHTTVHTFGKGWGFHGAAVLTSPIIREYLINFAKSVMFSTSMPYTDICALESCLDIISSERGQELRQSLQHLSCYAHQQLLRAMEGIPKHILSLEDTHSMTTGVHGSGLYSPVIPIFTPLAQNLADYLLGKGYGVSAMTFPVVNRPRIRMIIHARNTEYDIDSFLNELMQWAARQSVGPGWGPGTVVVRGEDLEMKARL